MIVEKPPWIAHRGEKGQTTAVYSVDVSSKGGRLATGGGDGKVRVWNGDAVGNRAANSTSSSSLTKQLAVLPCKALRLRHNATIIEHFVKVPFESRHAIIPMHA